MPSFSRSRDERVLTGLCGGLAEAIGVPPIVVRLVFVVLGAASAVGVLLYVVGSLLLRDERSRAKGPGEVVRENLRSFQDDTIAAWRSFAEWFADWQERRTTGAADVRRRHVIGTGLILLALLLFLASLDLFWWLSWSRFFALVLLGVGLSLVLRRGE